MRKEVDKMKKVAEEKMADNVQLRRQLDDQKNDNSQLQKHADETKDLVEKLRRDGGKLAGQLRQRQEELDKSLQANKALTQENRDLTSYLDRYRNENERLTVEHDRIKASLAG